jgi:hypothetical protein
MPKPKNLNEQTHRLTNLPYRGSEDLGVCQNCGRTALEFPWQEHDHNDNPEAKFIYLCKECGDMLIEPHPRLYRQITKNEPAPGVMPTCDGCAWRVRTRCTCPKFKFNGGAPGVKLQYEPPAVAFVDGPKFHGRVWLYHSPVLCPERREK